MNILNSCKSDSFAFGLILHQMIYGYHPYASQDKMALLKLAVQAVPQYIHKLKPDSTDLEKALHDLILKALKIDADERPGPKDLLDDFLKIEKRFS